MYNQQLINQEKLRAKLANSTAINSIKELPSFAEMPLQTIQANYKLICRTQKSKKVHK